MTVQPALRATENRIELENAFPQKIIGVLGLTTRRSGEKITELRSKNMLMHTDSLNGQRGIGFLVHREWKDKIKEFTAARTAVLRLKLNESKNLTLVQVYAPIAASSKEENEIFYNKLEEVIEKDKMKDKFFVIMADLSNWAT